MVLLAVRLPSYTLQSLTKYIWKVKKINKIGQNKNRLISTFVQFLIAAVKTWGRGDRAVRCPLNFQMCLVVPSFLTTLEVTRLHYLLH